MISNWIHPDKVIKFNLLFSSDKDGDRANTFHQICDGIFPTITVIQDTSGRKFGGYSTQNGVNQMLKHLIPEHQNLLFLIYQINKNLN